MFEYPTKGTCSRLIRVKIDGDIIEDVQFEGGCEGNLIAIPKLVKGMRIDDVAELLEGNDCHGRGTSCADQMVKALRAAQEAR